MRSSVVSHSDSLANYLSVDSFSSSIRDLCAEIKRLKQGRLGAEYVDKMTNSGYMVR